MIAALANLAAWLVSGVLNRSTDQFLSRVSGFLTQQGDVRVELRRQDSEDLKNVLDASTDQLETRVDLERARMQYAQYWALVAVMFVPFAANWWFLNLYGWFWCQDCMFPQTWTIAKYPEPYDQMAVDMYRWLFQVTTAGGVGLALHQFLTGGRR